MFGKVIRTLFPSFTATDSGPQYDYFERTRGGGKASKNSQANTAEQVLEIKPALQQTKRDSGLPLPPVQGIDPRFYRYLFGNPENDASHQELSLYIGQQLQQVMVQPELFLSALPAMPDSVTQVINLLQTDDFNINELIELIEKEPALAADLIKLANSPRYFRGSKPVADIRVAFTFMGAQGLVDGVLQVFIQQFSTGSQIYFKQFGTKIWQHCFQTAQYTQEMVAVSLGDEEKGVGYFAGLMRNLGYMVLFQLLTEAFKVVHPNAKPCSDTFQQLLDRYALPLTVLIAQHWQLPEEVMTALAEQCVTTPNRQGLGDCLYQADVLSQLVSLYLAKQIDREELLAMTSKRMTNITGLELAKTLVEEKQAVNG